MGFFNNVGNWINNEILQPIGKWWNYKVYNQVNVPGKKESSLFPNEKENSGNTQEKETPSIKELWEREDTIRKETQEREDTAYQRAVEDMRKAGINPNLGGINPANSGGGIASATGQELISTEMSGIINEAIANINNTVKADENQKDRITDIIKSLVMFMLLKK